MVEGKEVPASINLAWFNYGGPNANAGQLIVRYLIVWFPPLDVLSCFPIQTTALVNVGLEQISSQGNSRLTHVAFACARCRASLHAHWAEHLLSLPWHVTATE